MTKLQQIQSARRILSDWLGKGGQPVPIAQAETRAKVCLTCPHNYKGQWIWRMSTAFAIASQMKLRETMAIHLDSEADLKVCEICGCQLRLKVHVPFEHLYRHTTDAMFDKFPAHCWQKQELEQLKQTPK